MTKLKAGGWMAGAMLAAMCWGAQAGAHQTRNVVLIVSDGVRWQEMFSGADPALLDPEKGGSWEPEANLRKRFWSDDPAERRRRLFPFVWEMFAHDGQIYGNQHRRSVAHVANDKAFSYPGYNEMITGFPNPAIDSNEYGPNPNRSVFEWLNSLPQYRGQVAVFGTWDAYERIFNIGRSHLPIQAGWTLPRASGVPAADELLKTLFLTTTRFDAEDLPNALLQPPLLDYVRREHPRVLFVGYGETDSWAHQGRYDLVLDSANRTDAFVRELWQTMQSMPQYRDKTTFIFTTDHGRGSGPVQWREHGVEEKGSENIWLAVMGPDTRALGERHDVAPITQAQIAATVAALLGEDYRKAEPRAAAPITEVLETAR